MKISKELTERLDVLLKFISNEKNYYAMFEKVIESCAIAREINKACWAEEVVSDEKFRFTNETINEYRDKAIFVHRDWTIKMLENSATKHTRKSIVMSIYNDIFGIE